MSLNSSPPYDSGDVPRSGDHAVVLGGSMAGLLSARVLADGYDRVTIVERDPLPAGPDVRRGVPQGRHVHALQEAGRAILEDLFPGYSDCLAGAGATVIDVATDLRFYDEGDFVADGTTPAPMYCATRPLFEAVTLLGIAGRDDVAIRDGCQFTDYRLDETTDTVEGVTVRNESGDVETILADLVVDATGRTSRTPEWLKRNGYPTPPTDDVEVNLAYGTVYLDRPPGDVRAYNVLPAPPRKRGAIVLPVEDGRWVMTLVGIHGDHPPTDRRGYEEFADSLPVDAIGRLLEEHPVVSEGIAAYPFPSNRRRRYWDLDAFPDGLLVVGDAIASFNPVYGQGMSVAALEALALHHALARGSADGLASRFFGRVETIVEDAWNVAVGTDFRFPATTGPKPTGTDLLNRYLGRLTRKAHRDGVLADAYTRVVSMERRPTSLLHPSVAWRVLRPAIGPWRPASGEDARSTGPPPEVAGSDRSIEEATGAETGTNSSS